MIYTVTLNPAVDYVVRLASLQEGATNRAVSAEIQFGGKGINVSRVLVALGCETTVLGFVAGFTGEALTAHLREAGIHSRLIALPNGHTRINIKLKNQSNGVEETEINAPGPEISRACLEALLAEMDALSAEDTLVLAGSVPPGLPADIYRTILERLAGRGIRSVVDAEGDRLTSVLPYHPFLIKPNRAELEGIAGRPLPTEEDLQTAAKALQTAGAENVLVSLGADGALLLDADGVFHREKAFPVPVVNTVGAGDSMVAGFLAGIEKGYDYALKLALACGSATAACEGLATAEAISRLMP